MKKIILLRHAKSSWEFPYLTDYDRPLNERGINDAPKMAKWLSENEKIDLIKSSGAKRAQDTAKAFQAFLKVPLMTDDNLYHSGLNRLLRVIRKIDNEVNSVILLSHNPGLNELADYLLAGFQPNIPTTCMVGLKLRINKWSEISNKSTSLDFFQYPKNL
jgi:phosphohistidine phosphatase